MIVEDEDDAEEDDDEPSVPLEQYRAWLGENQSSERNEMNA